MAREPIFNAPRVVTVTLAVLALVHAGLALMPDREEAELLTYRLAFDPARYTAIGPELPGGIAARYASFLTHMVVHGDITHLLLNSVWLLAFGAGVASRIGTLRFIAFGLSCGLAGALAFLAVRWGQQVPMVGASGALSGLMGGACRYLMPWLDLRSAMQPLPAPTGAVARLTLGETMRDARTRTMILSWLFMNALMAVAAPAFTNQAGIAWEAHLGGFFFGLLAFPLFDRQRVVALPMPEAGPTLH